MAVIPEEYQHRAIISLVSTDIYKIDERVDEIHYIKDWLDELTSWQPDKYRWRITHSSNQIHVWFKDERHATICKLRWK